MPDPVSQPGHPVQHRSPRNLRVEEPEEASACKLQRQQARSNEALGRWQLARSRRQQLPGALTMGIFIAAKPSLEDAFPAFEPSSLLTPLRWERFIELGLRLGAPARWQVAAEALVFLRLRAQ